MKLVMGKRHWTPVALGVVFFSPAHSPAQAPTAPALTPAPTEKLGGRSTVDLIAVRPGTPGVPLRHGGVVVGSEHVDLDGRALRRGIEYSIDNDSGVIYLMVATKPGQSVAVTYRYDASRAQAGEAAPLLGLQPFKFNVGGGSMGVLLGMGLTERTADGSVLTSNVFGWNNSFSFGKSQIKGLMLYGERTQETAQSMYEYQAPGATPDQGKSRLFLESLNGQMSGGTYQLDYQDVSKNFTGFSAVQANGFDASVANQLSKERGMKRLGMALNNVKFGALGLSQSYRSVGDDTGGVTWRSYGIDLGGLSLNWKSQSVDQNFKRFQDLAEGDREQLAREAGLSRENWNGSLKSGLGQLSFNSLQIDDSNGRGIERQELKLDGSKFKFMMGQQEVQTGFTRFDSLFEAEKGQWGREAGLKRQWKSLDAAILGANAQPLKFAEYRIDSPTGQMSNLDASLGTKTWSFEHIERSVDKGFVSLPNLTQTEIDGNIAAISNMYVKGGLPVRPEERGWYLRSPGLSRDFTRISAMPFANWNLCFETLDLQGKEDGASVRSFSLNGKGLSLSYREQKLGEKFGELSSLMEMEKQRFGTLSGLNRTDLGFSADLAHGAKLQVNKTDADSPNGGFKRQGLNYADKQLQVSVNTREVDPNFSAINQLLDPETPVLSQMVGFKEADSQIKWQILPNLRVEAMSWQGYNDSLNERRVSSNLFLDWAPNKATQLQYQKSRQNSDDPLSCLFANSLERLSLTENLGKYGVIKYLQQSIDYDGSRADQPSAKQTDISYETKLNDKTSVKTQQVRTTYDNGEKENISANTVNTELTKRAGLSLTDVAIDRKGSDHDERKRNVGFWVNLWGGMRLNVGVNDALNNLGSDTTQHTVSLTPGTLGSFQVANANYMANSWEQGNRTQANSTISINTVKPFNLGFFKDVKLGVGQDTAADNGRWLRENKTLSFSGKVAGNVLGYEYRGQMDNQENRAVDRGFSIVTDQSEKSPLRANLFYKQRSLPNDKDIAIRNFSVTARPVNGLELTHQLLTNPELPQGDVLLGSVAQPMRVNKWKLDYLRDPNFKISGSWEEQRNDDNNALSRLGGVTFTMFEKKGSPLTLFLGSEQADGNVARRTVNRWSLRYDQNPGPNQMFSLFVGNVSYGGTIAPNEKKHNLTLDVEYQLKF